MTPKNPFVTRINALADQRQQRAVTPSAQNALQALYNSNDKPTATTSGLNGSGSSNSPAVQLSGTLPLQSYFDSTLLERAVIANAATSQIINPVKIDQSGYALGLAPWSQTPVSIRLLAGGQPVSSGTLTLKPGDVFRPYGLPDGTQSGQFSSFEYGLPYGWLGGGDFTLFVFKTSDAWATWENTSTEVLFHRVRLIISNAAPPAIADAPGTWYNWPTNFPWANGRNQNQQPQVGTGVISVSTTRTVFRVRTVAAAAGDVFTLYFRGTDDFDIGADGLTVATTDASMAGTITMATNPPSSPYQLFELNGDLLASTGGDFARLDLLTAVAGLNGVYVDICRYGVLS